MWSIAISTWDGWMPAWPMPSSMMFALAWCGITYWTSSIVRPALSTSLVSISRYGWMVKPGQRISGVVIEPPSHVNEPETPLPISTPAGSEQEPGDIERFV